MCILVPSVGQRVSYELLRSPGDWDINIACVTQVDLNRGYAILVDENNLEKEYKVDVKTNSGHVRVYDVYAQTGCIAGDY